MIADDIRTLKERSPFPFGICPCVHKPKREKRVALGIQEAVSITLHAKPKKAHSLFVLCRPSVVLSQVKRKERRRPPVELGGLGRDVGLIEVVARVLVKIELAFDAVVLYTARAKRSLWGWGTTSSEKARCQGIIARPLG
jgi:hypothetical protein